MNQAIPVFVFPDALHFAGDARTKTLSLYNPYDFALRFQSETQSQTIVNMSLMSTPSDC